MKKISSKSGFSLIEMIVIIAVIAILTSIVLINLSNAKERAKIAQAQMETKKIYDEDIKQHYNV